MNDYHQSTTNKYVSQISLLSRQGLETFGSWIDKRNSKRQLTISYKPADTAHESSSLFHEQARKHSAYVINDRMSNKFSIYGKFIHRIFPEFSMDKGMDFAFIQLAGIAEKWSKLDIVGERRFANLPNMAEDEKLLLAREIANQNRALATLGGVSGLAGLPGLFADTVWLLIVSLRTVYQMAEVYGKPLIGEEGVKLAFSIIASSDLNKMNEKQTVMAGLGVAHKLLANAEKNGLQHELKLEAKKHPMVKDYVDQVDELLNQLNIDLEKLNLSWFKKGLPLSSMALGMYYNSQLIEEIIGVTQATLAPEMKLAISD